MSRLSVDSIVSVNISMATATTLGDNGCNVGLIMGTSNVITVANRMKKYYNLGEMATDGFTDTMPEYLAAEKYFSQSPAPSELYVARYDSAAATPETPVTCYTACRDMASDFYGVYCAGASDANNLALAAAIDANGDNCLFFDTDNSDALVASPATADVFTSMKSNDYKCAIGIYSATNYAGAALMGLAMGLETGEENSAFDLFLKKLNGVTPTSNITEAQLTILKGKNGNAYVVRGQDIKLVENGNCVDGVPYDEKMYIELTKRVIQDAVLQQMTKDGVPKIPQTDDGMAVIVSAVTSGMEYMRDIGFVGPGTWTADPFRTIETGDMLDSGYQIFADSFSDQSVADRTARKAPNVYVAMKLAGSVRSVVIGLVVNE